MRIRTSHFKADQMLVGSIIGGSLTPLLIASMLHFIGGIPLWRGMAGGGQEFNPVYWPAIMGLPLGSLVGCIVFRGQTRSRFWIWIGGLSVSLCVLFYEAILSGYFALWLVDVAALGAALLLLMILRIRSGWQRENK
jgi:hypothetical protein